VKDLIIVMGSKNDWDHIKNMELILKDFDITYDINILSAHRTPENMFDLSKDFSKKYKVIIAAAGGAAHLPGMVASLTTLPVIAVPIKSSKFDGIDSILSMLQMPYGTPTALVGVDSGNNAALLAIKILAINNKKLTNKLIEFKETMKNNVIESSKEFFNN